MELLVRKGDPGGCVCVEDREEAERASESEATSEAGSEGAGARDGEEEVDVLSVGAEVW
jgi:hypothetical protein